MPLCEPIIIGKDVDFASLLGCEIKLKTEQFPKRMLVTKVVSISGGNLIIDRSGSDGLVDQLIGKQNVVVFMDYKGQKVKFSSNISKPREERIQIPIADVIVPIIVREYERINMVKDVRLTYFDSASISSARLNKLKWLETNTKNLSGGGMLVEIPASLSNDYYMILHLGLDNFEIPKLLLGKICHSNQGDNNHYHTGVEFITREACREKLSKALLRNLPPTLFIFDRKMRRELASFIAGNLNKNKA
jgi:c-di-GMP-binding flagellar brake protein YcgR